MRRGRFTHAIHSRFWAEVVFVIEIDGSHGEGGGQIIRTAIALSCTLGESIRIKNIRRGRKRPGLMPQHLAGVRLAGEMCDANIRGLEIGSTEIEFVPGGNIGGRYEIDVGTAGSVSLVLQTCMIPAILARGSTELVIGGGTDVPWSPPIDYLLLVLLPLVRRMGGSADIDISQRGFYPSGGGRIEVQIDPSGGLRGVHFSERGKLKELVGSIACRNLPEHIMTRIESSAVKRLADYPSPRFKTDCSRGPSAGVSIVIAAEFEGTVLGSSCLGEKGMPAEKVGEMAALGLDEEIRSGAILDEHATDQIIPFMLLAKGGSSFITGELSSHTRTNLWVSRQFIERDVEISDRGRLTEVAIT